MKTRNKMRLNIKFATIIAGSLALVVYCVANLVRHYSPASIPDFGYGFCEGFSLVFAVVFLILIGVRVSRYMRGRFENAG